MPVTLCYTQRVRGFQQERVKYSKESVEIRLKRTEVLKQNQPCRERIELRECLLPYWVPALPI